MNTTMRFEQHIYGRVAQGFRAQGPGFQLAAATESLLERPETVETLNRLSFCRRSTGEGPRERYSLLRPAPGWVAFGCARMAKDRGGAVGSFAHNLVCSEADFIASGASPVSILRDFTFFASEADLPSDRRLPLRELDRFDAPVRHPEWNAAALDLIDIYLGESALEVPMIVLDAARTWHLLDELFSLLPRQEAARLTFSTSFIEATDYLDAYRLVSVPGRSSLPRDEALYRIVEPAPEEDPRAARRHVPFTEFWRSQPRHGASLCRWTDLMRGNPASREIPPLLDELLTAEGAFRGAAENLGIKGIYEWLAQKPEWLESYHRAGGALDSALLRQAVWTDPQSRLLPALEGARNLGDRELMALLFEDLGRGVAAGNLDTALVAKLEEKGHLSQFLATVSDAHRFDDEELMELAGRLDGKPFYRGQLHQAVARRVLVALEMGRSSGSAERWIAARAGEGGSELFAAIAALVAWRDSSTWRRKELRLEDFGPLPPNDYPLLLRAAWTLARDARTFVRMAFREDVREAFFASCSHLFSRAELGEQRDLLAALAGLSPWGTEHSELIHAILASPKAHELAKHYAGCLERSPRPDTEAITRLRSVRPPESWLFRR
jgi:GTPase-associated protein 1, N-terminal domain type 2